MTSRVARDMQLSQLDVHILGPKILATQRRVRLHLKGKLRVGGPLRALASMGSCVGGSRNRVVLGVSSRAEGELAPLWMLAGFLCVERVMYRLVVRAGLNVCWDARTPCVAQRILGCQVFWPTLRCVFMCFQFRGAEGPALSA